MHIALYFNYKNAVFFHPIKKKFLIILIWKKIHYPYNHIELIKIYYK